MSDSKLVKVLVAIPAADDYGLPVNTAAGLEAGLTAKIQPPGNILDVAAPV
ncbi:hypothetical protein HFO91_09835 [Rhizobium leguminosarum]|uniref:hypothetical protein n=1 Tax=Rhizobium leguminosarum TaxID=384 RepID=UPI001C9543FB|nr:hypothetical protein [Rhizobium leguminosarum]MBY5367393.1 hypothetical protein [Rhizobium leguminosarum]MBY5449961.1 hypothetical protein [Rhizobium leguminosarum]